MNKLSVFVFLGLAALNIQFAEAQKIPKESQAELYCVNIPVQKVYPYSKGYMVVYRSGVNQTGTVYIPLDWFHTGVKKAELIQLGSGRTLPSMSIFYKEGAFHSVKLYVSKSGAHESWGFIPSDVNIDSRFEGVEALELHY